jgi:hypothetical protein
MAQRLFVFLQLEFPWILGPADGRYLMRDELDGEPERVVVIDTLGTTRLGTREAAAARPGRLGRRGRAASAPTTPEPAEVASTRATIVDPVSLSAENQARAWLDGLDVERELLGAAATVNRVLHFHRIASADPYVHEVSPAQAIVLRGGWGEGEQVAEGTWLHARQFAWDSAGRRRLGLGGRARASALRPQERLAQLLGARGRVLACEELALRARLDLDHERPSLAALELERAMALAVLELRGERRVDLEIRIAELEQLHDGVEEQCRTQLSAAAPEPDVELLTHALERLEAALRARSAGGFERGTRSFMGLR